MHVPARVSDRDDLAGVDAEEVLRDTPWIGACDDHDVWDLAEGCELSECWKGLVGWEVGFVAGEENVG